MDGQPDSKIKFYCKLLRIGLENKNEKRDFIKNISKNNSLDSSHPPGWRTKLITDKIRVKPSF